jgi:lipopolysaccharide export system protein LptC
MSPRDAGKAVAEPLPRRERPRIDWTARTRGTILDAERYSRFVGVMKRALPIAAGAIIMAVVAYSLVPRPADRGISIAYGHMGTLNNDLAMINPKLTGADTKGNPFVITADAAIQDPRHPRQARLKNIEADVTMPQNRWLSVTSTRGFIDADTGKIALRDGIAIFSDNGFELHTSMVDGNLKDGVMAGKEEVTGHGPMGTMRADHFTVDHDNQQIHLLGNVQMTIYKGAK